MGRCDGAAGRSGGTVEVGDGATVALAGSGGTFDPNESPDAVEWDAWVASVEWAVKPTAGCKPDGYWFIGDIVD
jgi:hypothetical protein